MSLKTRDWARSALKQQVEFFGGDRVSLDSLWRSAGSPAGQDPRRWSQRATALITGFAVYLEQIEGTLDPVDASRLLWIWDDESKEPWRTGDLMSHEFIAWAYATYLDTRTGFREARNIHESPSRSFR